MLSAKEMTAKADQCADMARKTHDRLLAHTFRELANQWRDMADQLDKLEHSQVYRIIRDRQDAMRK
jgi:hypothetical protein